MAIATLMSHFCEICEGQGLSRRLLIKHPHFAWKVYLDGGVRFSVRRDLSAASETAIQNTALLTPSVVTNDILNFNHALDHFGEGSDDNDYGGNGENVKSDLTPAPTGQPTVTTFTGNLATWRSAVVGYWRMQADIVNADSRHTAFSKELFDWFAAANVLAVLRDYAVSPGSLVPSALNDNIRHLNGAEYGTLAVGGRGFAELLGAYTTLLGVQADSGNPWYQSLRWFSSTSTVVTLETVFHPLYPASERETDGSWKLADRTAMATRLEAIFGRRILENTDTSVL